MALTVGPGQLRETFEKCRAVQSAASESGSSVCIMSAEDTGAAESQSQQREAEESMAGKVGQAVGSAAVSGAQADHGLEFAKLRAAVIDMDGVLWRGKRDMPGAERFFRLLRRNDIAFVLATNNASRTPRTYVERLGRLGVRIRPEEVVTSSIAAADYLAARYEPGTTVYAVGGEGLRAALAERGFTLLRDTSEPAAVVVVGIDFQLTYQKLAHAAIHIQRGAQFVATNGDRSYPAEEGRLPGAGSIVAAIETATDVQPLVVGKPHPPMYEIAMARLEESADRTLMIGDRLDTDIAGGVRAGMKTALVCTGIDDLESVRSSPVTPDAVFEDIGSLAASWERGLTRINKDSA
jgi:4-nitrophenyl phosphatase